MKSQDSLETLDDDGLESHAFVPKDLEFGPGNYEAIRHTCEAIGENIESWGFKRIMGSMWAFLYLCPEPATAKDICSALGISPALASITLQDLLRWGVVRKLSPLGKRRDYYVAEHDLWKMIRKVLKERERAHMESVQDRLGQALGALDVETRSRPDLKSKRTCQFQRMRVEELKAVTATALRLMDALIDEGRMDVSPILSVLQPSLGLTPRGKS
jgi:DNA-binding transcriptional regulator GbsR (MarR family)